MNLVDYFDTLRWGGARVYDLAVDSITVPVAVSHGASSFGATTIAITAKSVGATAR